MTVDELKKIFGVSEDQELGPLFGRTKAAVSVWRKKGIPPAIQMKANSMATSSPSVPSTGQGEACVCPQMDELDKLIFKSIAGFTPDQKRAIIEDIQKEKLLKELLRERAEREAA